MHIGENQAPVGWSKADFFSSHHMPDCHEGKHYESCSALVDGDTTPSTALLHQSTTEAGPYRRRKLPGSVFMNTDKPISAKPRRCSTMILRVILSSEMDHASSF